MLTQFEEEKEKLKNRIIKMAELALQQTDIAMKFLIYGDTGQTEIAEITEQEIDKLDVKVDKLCQRIIALNQPITKDLRFIMSSFRIGNELERVGDIAMSIVNRSEIVRTQPDILSKLNIDAVFKKSYFLIQKSFGNYAAFNSDNINEVISECHDLNNECNLVLDKIIIEMTDKKEIIRIAANLILILRQIDRLADHASNIAESIYFMNEGTIIKHGNYLDKKVLILCTGNSCRSQMAEAFLKSFNKNIGVFSAGTEPAESINPYAIKVMKEIGIDISNNIPKNVSEFLSDEFDYVITVCNDARETCPIFSGKVKNRLHLAFEDPAQAKGSEDEIMDFFRKIRDQIKEEFLKFNTYM
jgi:arsenate reductase (thioredoxin)